jgi:hypothetical protein
MPQPGRVQRVKAAAGLFALLSLAPGLHGQELGALRNRVTVSTRFSLGLKTEIGHSQAALLAPYDDGFVAQDISGSAANTWNWGYSRADQVNTAAGSLELHTVPHPFLRDNTTESYKDDPQAGFEIGYGRELGFVKLAGDRKLVWGLAGSFGSLDLNLKREHTLSGTVARTTDSYSYGGLTPGSTLPPAGYAGSFAGPGPLLAYHAPAPAAGAAALASALSAKVDGLIYGFKMGPFMEVPLFKRVTLQVGAGLAAVNADAEFSYTERFTLTGPATGGPPPTRSGSATRSEWLLGVYGSCTLSIPVGRDLSIVLGAQFQNLENMSISAGEKTATLKLGQTVEFLGGLRFDF